MIDKLNRLSSMFDLELLNYRIEELKHLPPFKPDFFEPTFTITQRFENGVEATLWFVIRNDETVIYNAIERIMPLNPMEYKIKK